ncbi:MAG: hypothetical protein KDD19_21645 [Phaeodactylibacter sp.]|nr:hypothetical protein [Phaeodactylibacter sp.]MCB9049348.1 hypothetical protein [Lewinellaceae bacterium]
MKKIYRALFLLLATSSLSAQTVNSNNDAGVLDDFGRINLNIVVPADSLLIDQQFYLNTSYSVANLLERRLKSVVARYGFTGAIRSPRFMIFPLISVIGRNYTATAPTQIIVKLEMSLYVADYIDKKTYNVEIFPLTGVGQSEERALLNAFNEFRDSKKVEQFLEQGRKNILQYYNDQCDFIMEEAETALKINNPELAFLTVMQVPQASSACFKEAMKRIPRYYAAYEKQTCEEHLHRARTAWAAKKKSIILERKGEQRSGDGEEMNPFEEGLSKDKDKIKRDSSIREELLLKKSDNEIYEALDYLEEIFPYSVCYEDAQKLVAEIQGYVDEEIHFETHVKYQQAQDLNRLYLEKSIEALKASNQADDRFFRRGERSRMNILNIE